VGNLRPPKLIAIIGEKKNWKRMYQPPENEKATSTPRRKVKDTIAPV